MQMVSRGRSSSVSYVLLSHTMCPRVRRKCCFSSPFTERGAGRGRNLGQEEDDLPPDEQDPYKLEGFEEEEEEKLRADQPIDHYIGQEIFGEEDVPPEEVGSSPERGSPVLSSSPAPEVPEEELGINRELAYEDMVQERRDEDVENVLVAENKEHQEAALPHEEDVVNAKVRAQSDLIRNIEANLTEMGELFGGKLSSKVAQSRSNVVAGRRQPPRGLQQGGRRRTQSEQIKGPGLLSGESNVGSAAPARAAPVPSGPYAERQARNAMQNVAAANAVLSAAAQEAKAAEARAVAAERVRAAKAKAGAVCTAKRAAVSDGDAGGVRTGMSGASSTPGGGVHKEEKIRFTPAGFGRSAQLAPATGREVTGIPSQAGKVFRGGPGAPVLAAAGEKTRVTTTVYGRVPGTTNGPADPQMILDQATKRRLTNSKTTGCNIASSRVGPGELATKLGDKANSPTKEWGRSVLTHAGAAVAGGGGGNNNLVPKASHSENTEVALDAVARHYDIGAVALGSPKKFKAISVGNLDAFLQKQKMSDEAVPHIPLGTTAGVETTLETGTGGGASSAGGGLPAGRPVGDGGGQEGAAQQELEQSESSLKRAESGVNKGFDLAKARELDAKAELAKDDAERKAQFFLHSGTAIVRREFEQDYAKKAADLAKLKQTEAEFFGGEFAGTTGSWHQGSFFMTSSWS